MNRVPGVKIERDAKGKASKVIFDLKQHRKFIEDYLDHLAIQSAKDEPSILWTDALEILDKKHGIKRAAK
jgi:hypothetical protein